MDIGLSLIRLVVGLTLASHGAQKLFGWFGGYGVSGTGQFLESLGFVPGRRAALLSGLTETGSGLLLALGLLTPLAAAGIVAVMLVAAISVHRSKGFFVSDGGYEYNLVQAAATVGVAFIGPGAWSLDAALAFGWSGPPWGAAALALGLAGGAQQLLSRRRQTHPARTATLNTSA